MLQVDLVGGVRGCIFASALLKRGPVGPPDGQAPGDGRFCVFSFLLFFTRIFVGNGKKDLVVELGVCIFALRFWKWGGGVL